MLAANVALPDRGTAGGRRKLQSPPFGTRAEAEAELAELSKEMAQHGPLNRSWLAVADALSTIRAASVVEEERRSGAPD
jgi:hypothetical protein